MKFVVKILAGIIVALSLCSQSWAGKKSHTGMLKDTVLISNKKFKTLSMRHKNQYIQNLKKIMYGFEVRQHLSGLKLSYNESIFHWNMQNPLLPVANAATSQCVIGGVLRNKVGNTCPTSGRSCNDSSENFKCGIIFNEVCISRKPLSTLSKRCLEQSEQKIENTEELLEIYNEFRNVYGDMLRLCASDPENNPDGCHYLKEQLKKIKVGSDRDHSETVSNAEDCPDGTIAKKPQIYCFKAPCPQPDYFVCTPVGREQIVVHENNCNMMKQSLDKYGCEPKLNGADCIEGPTLTCRYLSRSCRDRHNQDCEGGRAQGNFCHGVESNAENGISITDNECLGIKNELQVNGCRPQILYDRGTICNKSPIGQIRCRVKVGADCKWVPRPQDCPDGFHRKSTSKNICFAGNKNNSVNSSAPARGSQ